MNLSGLLMCYNALLFLSLLVKVIVLDCGRELGLCEYAKWIVNIKSILLYFHEELNTRIITKYTLRTK